MRGDRAPAAAPRTGSGPSPSGPLVRALVVVAVAGGCWANAIGNDFVWDDRLTAAAPPAVLARSGTYYRPLVMLSFALDRWLWNGAPAGFHATNVACHAAVGWLVGALATALGLGPRAALAAAVLFVVHPVQTEAVTYVSGRTDVVCALGVLAALLLWRRARGPLDGFAYASAAAFALALLAKEAAILAPLALLVPGAHPADRPPRPVLPLLVAAAFLGAWAATGGPGIAAGGLAARLPAIGVAAVRYAGLLVWPADLHLERFTPVPGWPAATSLAAWTALALLAGALVVVARRVPGGLFLLALAIVLYAPGSGVVPVYPAIADRALFTAEHFLYLPLVGLAPLAAGAWPPRARRAAAVVVALLVLAWGARVVDRNRDWRDEATLFRHTLAYDPPAARVWFNAANLALGAGHLDEAARLYEAALAREPGTADAHLNLGITRQRQGRRAEAEAEYRRALAADPRLAEAYKALAALLAARGADEEALRLWQEGQRRAGG